ncbi:helix-turn-helix domain-containing protein [Streptomyces canus]|uniref:PucR family transcriptional regulator n=1 Tax=Streptomyces canus TaxID=58343 RepID=UPI002E2DFD9A|nr:helix-turn-helix domain-containing protein [Streptomyces canus]
MTELEPQWAPMRDADAKRVWHEVLQPVALQLRESSAFLSAEIVRKVRAEGADLFTEVPDTHEAMSSSEEILRLLAQIILTGADPSRIELPPAFAAMIRGAVWRHVPLSFHTQNYRRAHQDVWQWMFNRVVETAPSSADLVIAVDLLTILLMNFVDRSLMIADQVHEAERNTWLQGAAASRAATIDDVLAGRERDVGAASARARYDLGRHHLGMIAWLDRPSDRHDTLSYLSEVVAGVGRSVGVESSVTHPLGSSAVAGWASGRRPLDADTVARQVLDSSATGLPDGVSLSLGEPGQSLDGFRRSHLEAGHARRVASLMSSEATAVTTYGDVAVLALCTADPEHAARFTARTLGRLAEPDDHAARLAETLSVYLSARRNRAGAAKRLSVHPNTVSYRVRQAEELLGRDIDENSLELRIALSLLPAVGGIDPTRGLDR